MWIKDLWTALDPPSPPARGILFTVIQYSPFMNMKALNATYVADQPKFPPANAPSPNYTTSPEIPCHIYGLPEEIFVMVFSLILLKDPYCMPKFQRTTLMLVCKSWRRLVTETPFFWTTIDCTDRRQQWEDYLIRSKGLPFTIDYDSPFLGFCSWSRVGHSHSRVAQQKPVPLFDWVISKLVPIQTLRFTDQASVETWASAWRVLSHTKLDLREIKLVSLGGDMWFQPYQDETFLGTLAPRLQSVTLHCVVIPWHFFAVSTLRSLSIIFHYQHLDIHANNHLPTHADLLFIMTSSPLLETVRIIGINKDRSHSSTTFPMVTPQQLKELTVESVSNGAVCELLEHLNLPQTARVNFTIAVPSQSTTFEGETEFAQLVSLLAGNSLLQDFRLELEETSLRATDLCHEVRLVSQRSRIEYEQAVTGFSEHARFQVVSASMSSGYSIFPELLFPRLTAIEVDLYTMLEFDISDVLSFVRARNSPNHTEEDKRRWRTRISRLLITGAPFGSGVGSAWAEIQTLVEDCDIEVRSLDDLD
ncbi:hypothetical protein FRC04_011935 [Tulasnella sp. 424]|nr:hypothetical protein FRC04_011935 [Tulasnella sp. 424]KAG8970087.1 hypothetical protein FRC05_000735 [Tulasnella sp. 425]